MGIYGQPAVLASTICNNNIALAPLIAYGILVRSYIGRTWGRCFYRAVTGGKG